VMAGGVDRLAPPVHIFQSPYSAALTTGDQDVVVSRAKLSQPLLPRGVEHGRDQHLNPQGPRSWGQFEPRGHPCPLERRGCQHQS
jgi:hypothetical protein